MKKRFDLRYQTRQNAIKEYMLCSDYSKGHFRCQRKVHSKVQIQVSFKKAKNSQAAPLFYPLSISLALPDSPLLKMHRPHGRQVIIYTMCDHKKYFIPFCKHTFQKLHIFLNHASVQSGFHLI